jgi:hypothetical protein
VGILAVAVGIPAAVGVDILAAAAVGNLVAAVVGILAEALGRQGMVRAGARLGILEPAEAHLGILVTDHSESHPVEVAAAAVENHPVVRIDPGLEVPGG